MTGEKKQLQTETVRKAKKLLTDHINAFDGKMRNTQERDVILEIIYTAKNYITLDEIKKELAKKGFANLVEGTIYNNVKTLIKFNLITQLRINNRKPYYLPIQTKEDSFIITCSDCGATNCYPAPSTENYIDSIRKYIEAGGKRKVIISTLVVQSKCTAFEENGVCEHKKK